MDIFISGSRLRMGFIVSPVELSHSYVVGDPSRSKGIFLGKASPLCYIILVNKTIVNGVYTRL